MARTPSEILEHVAEIIGTRGADHGDYAENMNTCADLQSSFVGWRLQGSQAAIQVALLKLSRIKCGGYNIDDYEDAVGYLAIATALAEGEAEQRTSGPERALRVLR